MKTFHGASEHVHTKIHSRAGVFSDVDRAYEGMTQTSGSPGVLGLSMIAITHLTPFCGDVFLHIG